MHITYDVSVGTFITILVTLAGFFIAAGRTTALIQQATKYISELRADFNSHVTEDMRRFDGLTASLGDAAVKQASVSATVTTMSATLSAVAAAQLASSRVSKDE